MPSPRALALAPQPPQARHGKSHQTTCGRPSLHRQSYICKHMATQWDPGGGGPDVQSKAGTRPQLQNSSTEGVRERGPGKAAGEVGEGGSAALQTLTSLCLPREPLFKGLCTCPISAKPESHPPFRSLKLKEADVRGYCQDPGVPQDYPCLLCALHGFTVMAIQLRVTPSQGIKPRAKGQMRREGRGVKRKCSWDIRWGVWICLWDACGHS